MSAKGTIDTRLSDAESKIMELMARLSTLDVRPAHQRTRRFQSLLGKTDASHAKGASGTISIWTGTSGSETDSGVNVTAYNRFANLSSGKWVWLEHNGFGWDVINAQHVGTIYARGSIGDYQDCVIGSPLGVLVPLTSIGASLSDATSAATLSGGGLVTVAEAGRYFVVCGCGIIQRSALPTTANAAGNMLLSTSAGAIQHVSPWSCGAGNNITGDGRITTCSLSVILDLIVGDTLSVRVYQSSGSESFSANSGYITAIPFH